MIDKLLALKGLVTAVPAQPAHADLEHAHWDTETHSWRTHPEPATQQEAA